MSHSRRREVLRRVDSFVSGTGGRVPVLLAPMAGACPVALSASVMKAGGVGGCGALLMTPYEILAWADQLRELTPGPFQMNLWVPSPVSPDIAPAVEKQRSFLSEWGPDTPSAGLSIDSPSFDEQFEAFLKIKPAAVSSIMGLLSDRWIAELKSHGIAWWATVTSTEEALLAQSVGADALIVQGCEAGGHRGSFSPESASTNLSGLIALVPRVCDLVRIPVIAAGGISDGRGIAAALLLGASAVQIGTGFLRTPEANIYPAYARELAHAEAHNTCLTRAYSGRFGRAIQNRFTLAAGHPDAPEPLPYPLQRELTRAMREDAGRNGDVGRMQMWAGQAATLSSEIPATELITSLWDDTMALIGD